MEVNDSKNFVGIRPFEMAQGQTYSINGLTQSQPLPSMVALFDDVSEAPIGTQLALQYVVPDAVAGLLTLANDKTITARVW